jgi:hypothetical protein
LFWGGKLFQQYVVDAWASIEQSMLNWVRFHQKELRADVRILHSPTDCAGLKKRDMGQKMVESARVWQTPPGVRLEDSGIFD